MSIDITSQAISMLLGKCFSADFFSTPDKNLGFIQEVKYSGFAGNPPSKQDYT